MRRPRFQFRLRTLFALTLGAIFVTLTYKIWPASGAGYFGIFAVNLCWYTGFGLPIVSYAFDQTVHRRTTVIGTGLLFANLLLSLLQIFHLGPMVFFKR
jgi:hypothetical protein